MKSLKFLVIVLFSVSFFSCQDQPKKDEKKDDAPKETPKKEEKKIEIVIAGKFAFATANEQCAPFADKLKNIKGIKTKICIDFYDKDGKILKDGRKCYNIHFKEEADGSYTYENADSSAPIPPDARKWKLVKEPEDNALDFLCKTNKGCMNGRTPDPKKICRIKFMGRNGSGDPGMEDIKLDKDQKPEKTQNMDISIQCNCLQKRP